MVNAQEWLDKNYSQGRRKNIITLNINGQNKTYNDKLKGSLNLEGFVNLEELNCSYNKITDLELSNCSNLRNLDCSFNGLADLDSSNCLNLTEINCYYNYLTDIKLPNKSGKLELINVANNCFPKQGLSRFSCFINLKKLSLGNWRRSKMERGICNHFAGSLEPLKNLIKLRSLDVENTDINNGLEYLPTSVEVFHCQASERLESKVGILEIELSPFVTKKRGKIVKMYNLPVWRKANQEMVEVAKILSNLELALTDGIITDPITDKFLQVFIFQMQERLIELWKNKHQELQTQIEIPSKK